MTVSRIDFRRAVFFLPRAVLPLRLFPSVWHTVPPAASRGRVGWGGGGEGDYSMEGIP
jgi:hypothetical protein